MAKPPNLDWFTRITAVQFDDGFLLSVRAFNVSPTAILSVVTATFQDHDIGRVINGTEEIPAHGVPTSTVQIVDPPTKKVKSAYRKWHTKTLVDIGHFGEGGSVAYTVSSIAYFHVKKDQPLTVKVDVTGLGPLGVTNIMAVFGQLFNSKGEVVADAGDGSANIPNHGTFTIVADAKAGTVVVTRFPDP